MAQVVQVVSSLGFDPCSVEGAGNGHLLCDVQAAREDGPVELDKVILVPMVVHRNLAIHYQKRMVEGYNHDEVMDEIKRFCGLPEVWRGYLPFTGTSSQDFRMADINWTMWFLLLAWLAWSFLSLRDTLPG